MNSLVKLAQLLKEDHEKQLQTLADRRLLEMAEEWVRRFPKRNLHIVFGNGTYFIKVDEKWDVELYKEGCNLSEKYRIKYVGYNLLDFSFLRDTLLDVLDIMNDFESGSPNDLIVHRTHSSVG